MKTGKAMTAYS